MEELNRGDKEGTGTVSAVGTVGIAGTVGTADTAGTVTVVAHCLLNPLTRVKGLRTVSFHAFQAEGPLIQLPCPEALYMGLDRWAVTRNQLDVPEFRRFCRSLIIHYADLLEMLAKKGFSIRIMGVAGSPSCGINTTTMGYQGGRVMESDHEHISDQGIFMEELLAELERRGIPFEAEELGKSACAKGLPES